MIPAYQKATGIAVPQLVSMVENKSGADLAWVQQEWLYRDALVDVSDIADAVGKENGGWCRSDVRTVPIGVVGELIRGDAFYWGQLMAGALLGSVPVALIYSFFVKYYVAGLTAGSVKG